MATTPTKTRTRTALAPRRTAPIVAAPQPRRRVVRASKSGILGTGVTLERAAAAYFLGALRAGGRLARVPTVASLGAEATISIVAAQVGGALGKDLALVSGIIALQHMGSASVEGAASVAGPDVGDEFDVQTL